MGVTTEVCVQTSMREANDRGYDCLLLEDCTESYFPAFKAAAVEMMRAQGAIVGWTAPSAVAGRAGCRPRSADKVSHVHTAALVPTRPATRPAHASRADEVYAQLKRDVAEFKLVPGDRFTENELCERLGVSRTPVRQALFRLQQEGYVEVLFRSGWRVLPFDFDQFEQLYDLRMVLETTAAQRLCADGERVDRDPAGPAGRHLAGARGRAQPDMVQVSNGTKPFTAAWWRPPAMPRWPACTAT
jgi:biotin operon repressor